MAAELGSRGVRSEINVTPLIDVVLVLLIIFMVLTPTLEARFAVALPQTDLELEPPVPETAPLLVELGADGTTTLNGEPMDLETLTQKLAGALRGRADRVAFFEAAEAANYGRAVEVMDVCRRAGADHIGMVEPVEAASAGLPVAPSGTISP